MVQQRTTSGFSRRPFPALTAAALAALAGTPMAYAQQGTGPARDPGVAHVNGLHEPQTAAGTERLASEAEEQNTGRVQVNDDFVVELHVNDEDLGVVLQMLSIQTQRNIVVSNSVSARVTANLYGVTFWEALDAILHVNGYGYIERGNFIYVYTLDELATIEQATRRRMSRTIKLNYLNAVDAAQFAAPLLSTEGSGGQIQTNGRAEDFSIPDSTPTGGENFALESTLVIYDYEENVEEIEALLRTLDTKPAQVLVEARILQTSIDEANAFGVDFAVVADLDFADFVSLGGPLNGPQGLLQGSGGRADGSAVGLPTGAGGTALATNVGNQSGPSTFKLGVVSNDVSFFLRMLDEVTDTTLLSNPKILALNRQPARVLVGRRVGYLSTTATDTSTTQTVEFLDTGTLLYFRPFVTNDGFIRMELKPQVSDAIIRESTDSGGSAVTIPDEITNEITTNVMVKDGQTIVLGGLFREVTTASRRQVPIVGDIPIIGNAFRGYDDDMKREEIIFMITPSIVNDTWLSEQGQEAMDYTEYVRVGTRKGLLPWSRERQCSQLLIKAREYQKAGETEKAIHCVERALELHPQQPDAIKLRAQLTGRFQKWPNRSMLDDIVHSETEDTVRRVSALVDAARAGSQDGRTPADFNETIERLLEIDPNAEYDHSRDSAPNFDGLPLSVKNPQPRVEIRPGELSKVDDIEASEGLPPEQRSADAFKSVQENRSFSPGNSAQVASNFSPEQSGTAPGNPFATTVASASVGQGASEPEQAWSAVQGDAPEPPVVNHDDTFAGFELTPQERVLVVGGFFEDSWSVITGVFDGFDASAFGPGVVTEVPTDESSPTE